ncbi:putative DNA pantothenate metabolism flavoprotein [Rosellinia necatrix]|uniref:Putative DNA pantothenate metabolism flavoprotein n=1 Tax=Rosellinia necatrix TaxID=77044 RepID=A0A1W2TWF9_ROSNE|nr:putative DNA pantothenate metabolism flavoprotein [Rosellinia necatrix]
MASQSEPTCPPRSAKPENPSAALSLSFKIAENRPPSRASSISSSSSQDSMASDLTQTTASSYEVENAYFSSNPPPKSLPQHIAAADEFISHHAATNRRVVLITSGGTTVPLEKNTVRFIDNFSAGTRGATSAEYFLEAGYAVIFLHRQFSLLPYSRHYSHSTDCFLDFLHEAEDGSAVANPAHQQKMLRVLRKYNTAKRQNLLLMLPFVTITDYLHELRGVAQLMRPLGPNGLLYLAAAVSDFFVPPERMSEHKIQSTNATDRLQPEKKQQGPTTITSEKREQQKGGEEDEAFDNFDSSPAVPRSKRLIIDLDPVPKFLKNLVDGWAPEGMIVSFKLETDPGLLVHKAKYSLNRYQHHLVIGNLLTTRKWEVVFVSPGREDQWIRVPIARRKKTLSGSGVEDLIGVAERESGGKSVGETVSNEPMDPASLPEGEPEMEIESLIIPTVQELHDRHVDSVMAKNLKAAK